MTQYHHDVMIVGGGMVGMTIAILLAQQTELSIALIESAKQAPIWDQTQQAHRVSAITLASQRLFEKMDVWHAIAAKRISPFNKIQVWDALQHELGFQSNDIAEFVLGYIIENSAIQQSLADKLTLYPQIHLYRDITLQTCEQQAESVTVTSTTNISITAKLAIAADGANSWLREMANIDCTVNDYGQTAIVTTLTTEWPHEQTARQIFLADGPIAFLPLQDSHTVSLVWSLPHERAQQLMQASDEHFLQRLTTAFPHLGTVLTTDTRYSYPLSKRQATAYQRHRIVLAGDAAHTVHPLAGQGVNMGLMDAACLVEVISDALQAKREFTGVSTLRRYERWRKADNTVMSAGIDLLKNLFASEKPTLTTLRGWGLRFAGRNTSVKNLFTRYATGIRPGLPRSLS